MIKQIQDALTSYSGMWRETKKYLGFRTVIAERKSFLFRKKLTYASRLNIDEKAKEVKFSEMLIENSSGLSGETGFEDGISTDFGFKAETYNIFKGRRSGTIAEQSTIFEKKFEYKFHYEEIRKLVEKTVTEAGYKFEYQILPLS